MFNDRSSRKTATIVMLVLGIFQIWLVPVSALDVYAHQDTLMRLVSLWAITLGFGVTMWLLTYAICILWTKLRYVLRRTFQKKKGSMLWDSPSPLKESNPSGVSVSLEDSSRTKTVTKLTDAQHDELLPLLDKLYDNLTDTYNMRSHKGPVPSAHFAVWSKINAWYPELDVGKDDEDIHYVDDRRVHNTLKLWNAGRTLVIITSRMVDAVGTEEVNIWEDVTNTSPVRLHGTIES